MSMHQPLIKRKLLPRQLSHTPSALLIGKAGAGKTALANKLSEITYQVDVVESRIPKEQHVYSVTYDRNAFLLIDTSGTDITKRLHTQADSQEISTIFFVIKYDTRFEKMISAYLELEVSVTNNTDKIVVMISHWDQSKNPEEDFKEICDLFVEECPHLVNIIFYSEQHVDAKIAELIYSCISNMDEVELISQVSKDGIENTRNTSSEYGQEAGNEVVNNCSNSIDDTSTTIDDSDYAKEEPRVKNALKRSFDQCQSISDSCPILQQENETSSEKFNENASHMARNNPKKIKQESNTSSFWRRFQDYCSIS